MGALCTASFPSYGVVWQLPHKIEALRMATLPSFGGIRRVLQLCLEVLRPQVELPSQLQRQKANLSLLELLHWPQRLEVNSQRHKKVSGTQS